MDSFADSVSIVVGSGHIPVADAGLPRYAGTDPVQLDGRDSYDPDNSGPLSYQWQLISGPTVTITDGDTPTPTISGFTPTDSIQRCEFQLIVNDGEYESLPGTVFVIIVHNRYSQSSFRLESGAFDPEKPTIIHFGRGGSWGGGSDWNSRANILSEEYDSFDTLACGDQIITYLSSVAPNYSQSIQLSGCSGGAWASIEVAAYMNRTYQDRRYAVNHVTLFDGGTSKSLISRFLISAVDGEQCWVDSYIDYYATSQPGVLNVEMYHFGHCATSGWYKNSLTGSDMNDFNSPVAGPGVVAGAYWSVIGPGKNLQLASTTDTMTYRFKWEGSTTAGYMDFYDESLYPGRLPEPVTLSASFDTAGPGGFGFVLSCEESQNAVGYQLLMGPDPYRVMDYNIISDTPYPPNSVITTFPFEDTWWTVKARDQYGSTIYADPQPVPALEDRYVDVVDDMESYNTSDNMISDTWLGWWWNWTGSWVELWIDPCEPVHAGRQSMKYNYDNSGGFWGDMHYYSEIERTFADPCDWTVSGIKALTLYFYGDADNDANDTERMYVGLKDTTGTYAEVKYGDNGEDMNDIKITEWQEWNIALSDFNDVNLACVEKIYIGFGERGNLNPGGTPGGSGVMYFDDIRLYPRKCILGLVSGADLSGDCIVNSEDFAVLANQWKQPPGSPSADIAEPLDSFVDWKDLDVLTESWLEVTLWPSE